MFRVIKIENSHLLRAQVHVRRGPTAPEEGWKYDVRFRAWER